MGRSGNEPNTARSPLRLRLALAVFGIGLGLIGVAIGVGEHQAPFTVAGAVITVIAVIDVAVVLRRIRQGPHYQPGRDIPPYVPVEPLRVPSTAPLTGSGGSTGSTRPARAARRQRIYLAMMGTCLFLVALSWIWLRQVSTTAAVVVGVVAMVIPPVASIVANAGWDDDLDRRPPPPDERD